MVQLPKKQTHDRDHGILPAIFAKSARSFLQFQQMARLLSIGGGVSLVPSLPASLPDGARLVYEERARYIQCSSTRRGTERYGLVYLVHGIIDCTIRESQL